MIRKLFLVPILAVPAWAQEPATDPLTAAGCGPSNVQFDVKKDKNLHPTGQAESGKALVYVFGDETREANVTYFGGPTVRLGLDGEWIGASPPSRGRDTIGPEAAQGILLAGVCLARPRCVRSS